jgi:uncharacterized protein YdeI (YjbR/CyaY-like superfamily)
MMQDMSEALVTALARDQEARATFAWMAPSHRDAFSGWVQAASGETEQRKRVRQAVDMLAGRDPVRRN